MLETTCAPEKVETPQTAIEIPDYWQSYGLNHPPFEETSQYAMYYPLQQWKHYVEYLQQLADSSYVLTLAVGTLGSGKSMLIAQFLAQANENVPICLIKGHVAVRFSNLVQQLVEGFNIPDVPANIPLQAQIKALVKGMSRIQRRGIVLVDDTHRLPLESLSALVQLALEQFSTNEIVLHIVLFGELQLQNRTKNLLEILAGEIEPPVLMLKHLTFDETKSYIKHRMMKAGLSRELPFDEAALNRIYRLSGGVPGKINRIARQLMLEGTHYSTNSSQTIKKSDQETRRISKIIKKMLPRQPKITSIVALILLALVFWFMHLYYQESWNPAKRMMATKNQSDLESKPAAPESQTAETPTSEQSTSESTDSEAGSEAATPESTNPAPAPASSASEQNSEERVEIQTLQPAPGAQEQAPAQESSTSNVPVAAVSPEQQVQAQPQPQPQAGSQSPQETQAQAAQVQAPAKEASPQATASTYTDSEKRLLASGGGYTLQLMASYHPTDLERFVAKNHLQGKVESFHTQNNGKDWYVLVYGSYPNLTDAKLALAKLSNISAKQKPWVRSFESIHKALEVVNSK